MPPAAPPGPAGTPPPPDPDAAFLTPDPGTLPDPSDPKGVRTIRGPETCDLIMKGGITSGIVYPSAVLVLAKKYRFRGIGGASAGAIAAAATAAAEFGRRRPPAAGARVPSGFAGLRKVAEELTAPGKLLRLFQPAAATKPLYDLLIGYLDATAAGGEGGRWAAARLVVDRAVGWFVVVAAAVLVLMFGLEASVGATLRAPGSGWHEAVAILAAVAVGLLAAVAGAAHSFYRQGRRLIQAVKDNHHGVCTGLRGDGQPDEALTEFLHTRIQNLAGRTAAGDPLTFGELKTAGVELALMTCNVSLQRPYRFPLRADTKFLYDPAELRQFFPTEVVDFIDTKAGTNGLPEYPTAPGCRFRFLPGDDLPVLVAVRMSLSFPLLFGAVPLYCLTQKYFDRVAGGEARCIGPDDLRRNYFSDGGIVSNFPIHMFDRWLPDSPTFGINLADMNTPADPGRLMNRSNTDPMPTQQRVSNDFLVRPVLFDPVDHPAADGGRAAAPARPAAPVPAQVQVPAPPRPVGAADDVPPESATVYLPRADDQPLYEWQPITTLRGLAEAVFYTAKNHRDTLQAQLPSYRERIVTVRLTSEEGGMNLNMPEDVIRHVADLGTKAGETLCQQFRFEHHLWVRFQVVMAHVERELWEMVRYLRASRNYATVLPAGPGADYPFPRDHEWCQVSLDLIEEIREALEACIGARPPHFDDNYVPLPQPDKRFVPRD